PHVAENFAADADLHRLAARHDPARGRQDARAEARQHVGHGVAAEVDAAAGAADTFDPGDDALAARAVLQEHPEVRVGIVAGPRLEHREALDVTLVLEDLRDLDLEPR